MTEDELYALLVASGVQKIVQRGNNLMACCPKHDERNQSWGISIDHPHDHGCFACSFKGNIVNFLTDVAGKSKSEARRVLNMREADFRLPSLTKSKNKKRKGIPEDELYPFLFTKRCSQYLRLRGIRPSVADKLELLDHHKDDRILMPWYLDETLVGVTGRTLVNDSAKTLPYFGTKKGQALYLPSRTILPGIFFLVEGEFDAIKIFDVGHPNVGALCFGTFTDEQASLLLNSPVSEIRVFSDDDATGDLIWKSVKKKLGEKKFVSRVDISSVQDRYKEKIDPAAMLREDLKRFVCMKKSFDWLRL